MAKLIFIGEKFDGRVYEFALDKTTVGRGEHNTLTLQDASVSHAHAEVLVYGAEVIVRDLGSSNGTFVNGVRLHDQQRPLHNGQVVKFGSVAARLELESPTTSDTVTDVTAVYAHARHLREPPIESKPADLVSATIPAGRPIRMDDHTLVLPRPPQTAGKSEPPPTTLASGDGTTRRKPGVAFVLAAIVIGLVVICWWVLVKSR